MNQRLESFIKNTFALLKSDFPKLTVYAYDVCNELFVNNGGGLRPASNSKWMQIYNDDSFIINAIHSLLMHLLMPENMLQVDVNYS